MRAFFTCCLILIPSALVAAVFGDANPENGVEDQRQTKSEAEFWPQEFRAVGRLMCDSLVEGSAILLDLENGKPAILTAAHVLTAYEQGDCVFAPESNGWGRHRILDVIAKGQIDVLAKGQASRAKQYESDWVILSLEAWPNWQFSAVKFVEGIDIENPEKENDKGHLVGFDVAKGRMSVHSDCDFGHSQMSSLMPTSSDLLWDECDTSGGSSGGALFVNIGTKMALVGMRVGTLFDQNHFESVPAMGSKFDLDRYINVSKNLVGFGDRIDSQSKN